MKSHWIAASAACIALTQPAIAQTKQACVAPADISAGVIYAMPIAYDAAKSVCAGRLEADGFMATKGDDFVQPFRAKQNQSWPGAFRLIKTFMAQQPNNEATGGVDVLGMVSSLPESSLRPFLDGMMGQMIAKEIKPKNCSRIEQAMELLGPVPTENVAGIFAFIAEVSDLKNPSVCAPKE